MGTVLERVAVSGAALKGLYNQGRVQGRLGSGPEKNPYWNAVGEVRLRYQAAWEQGRQMGRRDVEQTQLAI
jgi:hypothetical protein